MKKTMLLMLVLALVISGCSKEKEGAPIGAFARPTKENTSQPFFKEPVAASVSRLPLADTSTPWTSYVKMEDGNQVMFMYYALSGLPVDYEKIASHYSQDYLVTSDGFKRQDILKALQPRIDAEIKKAKSNRYFIYTITGALKHTLQPYNFTSKSFSLNRNIWASGSYSYFRDNPSYKFSFTNGEDFKELHVENAEVARKIEGLISGSEDATLTIYAFVQDADPSKGQLKAQIVTMQFTDAQGNVLTK